MRASRASRPPSAGGSSASNETPLRGAIAARPPGRLPGTARRRHTANGGVVIRPSPCAQLSLRRALLSEPEGTGEPEGRCSLGGTVPTRCCYGVVQPSCAALRLSARHRWLWRGWVCGQHLVARTSQQAFSGLAYGRYANAYGSAAERDICRGGHGCGTSPAAACDRIKPRTGHCPACRPAYRGDRSSDTCRARCQGRRAPRDRPR